uniref:Uncharacterized protein n=1 Tax=Rhizophora mucronata TaxID=61149 RepID=A0A2P2NIF2_RHIMU
MFTVEAAEWCQRKRLENGVFPGEICHILRPQQKRITMLMKHFCALPRLH